VPADIFLPGTAINGGSGSRLPLIPRNALARDVKNRIQLNCDHQSLECSARLSGSVSLSCRGTVEDVAAGIDFASPFGSLDLQLKKDIRCGKHATVSLMGEAFNILNETNIRGTTNANYSGRNI